ncbi:D-mannonate dehydratase [Acidothermus cellulolyticus 11B]|uniref:D-mannonate dehydratase n=1 Tax=Acidothermus cellulolyticus (strain ATCC 43068 / DSM 8971 / 11B) TaxID=351607 RepID=A0LQW4_ACIC1|nr:D-mannonate dehydratase ManD [Acidothermus cellulolyticus]ABK51824.1 D-mannonate dehydratase [Acidothermus cellulolyticus 11B]
MSDRIVDAKVIVTCPGRNFVTLKLTTADGVTGLGDATLNGRELAVATYLQEYVCPLLLGRDPAQINDTWQYLYRGAYWRRGPVTMASIAAVDMALWDIKAKTAGMPLYQLLGGRARDGVTVYGHANGRDIPEVLDEVAAFLERGYKAVRVQVGIPGLGAVYGVSKDRTFYEPATGTDRPEETRWSTEAYLHFVPQLFAAVRDRFGFDFHLLHDAHHRLTPTEAAKFGKRIEEYDLFWLEDPTPAEAQDAFRIIKQHTTTPIAVGEVFNTIWDCHQLISERLIDFIRVTPVHAGGVSHVKRIVEFADLYGVRSGFHGATDMSPVCMAAAIHLDMSIANFGLQEYMHHTEETNAVFRHAYYFADGCLHPGDEPGLGVTLDEELAATFPYRRAYLPVNRLLDGTMFHW